MPPEENAENEARASRKLAFFDFFEIAASCNLLDYCELQHRIFKVTSKKLKFLEVPRSYFSELPAYLLAEESAFGTGVL